MRRERNIKKQKVHLVFDEDERKNFLLGFCKRKAARKLKAKEQLEQTMKEQKKQMKKEQKEALYNMIATQRPGPEIEPFLQKTVYDLPEHSVEISEVFPSAVDETESPAPQAAADSDKLKGLLKRIKVQRMKLLQTSSVASACKTLQKKKDKKEAKRKMQLLKKTLKKAKKNKKNKMGKKNK